MWLRSVGLVFAVTLTVGCAAPVRRTPRVTTADASFQTAPTVQHVFVTEDHLLIDEEIHFAPNSDVIEPASYRLLEEIAEVLKVHPEIDEVDVIGHAVAGDDAQDQALPQRRAAAVVEALRIRGVLTLIDVGEPADDCSDEACLRRVELVIQRRDS